MSTFKTVALSALALTAAYSAVMAQETPFDYHADNFADIEVLRL